MLRKLLGFTLLAFSSCTIIYSQKTPETSKQPAKPEKPSVWTFSFDGGSFLGVEPAEVTKDNFGKFGLREVRGVAVEKVVENSPAAQADLQPNDVIVKFDGEEIASVRKLTRLISEVAPDHQVKLTVLRGGSEQELTATMGRREAPEFLNGNFRMENMPKIEALPKMENMPKMPRVEVLPRSGDGDMLIWKGDGESGFFFGSNRQIGVSVSTLGKQLGEYFGVADGNGLLVNNVRENSPAAKAGLKAGDVIVEADGKEVKNNADLIRALNEKKEGDVRLTIIRDRNRQTISVTPEKLKGDVAPLFEDGAPTNGFRIVAPEMKNVPFTTVTPGAPVIAPALPKRVL